MVVQERAIVNQLRRADQEEELVVQERAVVNLLKRADQEEELVVPRRRVSRGFFRYNMDAPNIITDEGIIRYATVTPALLKREAERQYKRSAAGSMRAGLAPVRIGAGLLTPTSPSAGVAGRSEVDERKSRVTPDFIEQEKKAKLARLQRMP